MTLSLLSVNVFVWRVCDKVRVYVMRVISIYLLSEADVVLAMSDGVYLFLDAFSDVCITVHNDADLQRRWMC